MSQLLTEIGKSKKLQMIEKLRERSMGLKELANDMSTATVSRNLRWLCEHGIICRHKNSYKLTGFGAAIGKIICLLRDIEKFKEDIQDIPDFIEFLSPEIIAGLHLLDKCRIMNVEEALSVGLSYLLNSKQYGLYVDKIIDYDIYKMMVLKNLEGVNERVISTKETILDRTSTIRRALMDMNLSEREVQIRVYDTPIQLGVIDGEIGILQLNDRIDRIYVSDDRDFIRWCEYLFWFIWQRSEPVDVKKIIDEVKAQKGLA